ncbi:MULTISPECIES: hypothetical protein [unclassified Variovorax]|uniref:hypothetical protein n=1 Tax=unclassified Variovorax TaxID=663243 RepID=UPI00131864BA|nr:MULTISPECIES: hypothetical protein [unclassified Variovorax]VTU29332.1 hypothetical protein SRS16CHR_04448 [Variovorax sp. SRS16]VTU36835.1 hypothetical protein E5CHR_04416 [Variovorax sp. PBL-E5]
MITALRTSSARALHWLSAARRARIVRQTRLRRRRRQTVFAQAHGQIMLLDCQRHLGWWSGVVKIRDASQDRVVHVCCELRASMQDALGDAEQDAQRLALMFAQ